MDTKVPLLFDLASFEKRKTPEQKQFEETNRQLLLDFREFVEKSMKRLHKVIFEQIEPESQDNKLPAIAMSGFLRGEFIRNYSNYCRKATRLRFKLITENGEWIYIKKLDRQKKPSNVETRANNIILYQLTALNHDKGANVFLGYTEPGDFTKVTGTYAVCIDGAKVQWISDLSLLEQKIQATVENLNPKVKGPSLKEGVVRLKKKRK